MMEILRNRKGKMIVELEEGVEGVFKAKTDLRRGYCQDLLSVTHRAASIRRGSGDTEKSDHVMGHRMAQKVIEHHVRTKGRD